MTEPEDTARRLLDRLVAGKPCAPKALRREDAWRRRYDRVRKRVEGGWPVVVSFVLELSREAGQELRPHQLYDRLPLEGWLCEISGDSEHWRHVLKPPASKRALTRLVVETLQAYVAARGGHAETLAPHALRLDEEWGALYSCVNRAVEEGRLDGTYRQLVERATGIDYDRLLNRVGRHVYVPRTHQRQRGADGRPLGHHGLRSLAEAAVDDLAAAAVGATVWELSHRHDVPVRHLAHGFRGQHTIDVALYRDGELAGVVEIGAGGLLDSKKYVASRKKKRAALEAAGVPLLECDLRGGRSSEQTLSGGVRWIGARLGQRCAGPSASEIRATLVELNRGAVLHFGQEETAGWIRRKGVQTRAEYEDRRQRDIADGDPEAAYVVPGGTLNARLEDWGLTWHQLAGKSARGRGSAKAQAVTGLEKYSKYDDARRAARRGKFKNAADYLRRATTVDPKLPALPDHLWPEEFARDGWSGFLGTGAANHEVEGWTTKEELKRLSTSGDGVWKRLLDGVPHKAQGHRTFYDPRVLTREVPKRLDAIVRRRDARERILRALAALR